MQTVGIQWLDYGLKDWGIWFDSRKGQTFLFFPCGAASLTWAMASSLIRFLGHTQRCFTVGRNPLYEWSAGRRGLYLTTHNTHKRPTSTPLGMTRTQNLSRQTAVDLRLRPRGRWDWRTENLQISVASRSVRSLVHFHFSCLTKADLWERKTGSWLLCADVITDTWHSTSVTTYIIMA